MRADSMVTGITEEAANLRCSFLVAPDGSTEGRQESFRGDAYRDALVTWLGPSDGVDWVEVCFEDASPACVVRDSRDQESES